MSTREQSRIVVGRYLLCDPLASGGMGVVHYATTDRDGGKSVVAVKRLHPHLRNDEELSMMLLDEARLAVRIEHPNVVRVLDVVSTPTDLLLVMEYVAGASLSELVSAGTTGQRVPTPLPVAIAILVDALEGLQASHEAVDDDGNLLHLVHRDVSPQNLLVEAATGITKLTDFGVAKAVGRLRSTHDGSIRGKIAYMSPEQVAGQPLDARNDVYGAAVVLWELLAGRAMFTAENEVALFGRAMRGPTERLAEAVPDVPPKLDAAVWRALARDPRRRYPSARAFADALRESHGPVDRTVVAAWAQERGAGVLARRAEVVAGLLAQDTIIDRPRFLEKAASPPLQRRFGVLLAGMAATCIVGAGYAALRRAPPRLEPMAEAPGAFPLPPPLPSTPVTVAVAEPEPPVSAAPSAKAAPPRGRSAAGRKADKTSKADCNPPYTEDEAGRHFKPWCLH